MQQLLDIMQQLRDPHNGCPWDLEQDFSSIAPYTIEEAYEVADAIARDSMPDLKDELGDLLFQVVFHAQMARERGSFDFAEVHRAVCEKMLRRHPHVFGDQQIGDARQQTRAWEDYKAEERKNRGEHSLMDGIAIGMAELQRAVKLQKRAAKAGFDWASPAPVADKINEELAELETAVQAGDMDAMEDELGDLLFAVTNLSRKLEIDPGRALRRSNAKFEQRFRALERNAGGQESLKSMTLGEMESIWQQVKLDGSQGQADE